ncbi:MAG: GGDEF domain-containing protein [Xanthobacteraceae bacterium]|nr:GGDEF domain-containing protein [Xanthobacteraceae bacterium]
MLDYNSLLVALSFCSMGLAITFFVSWLVSRSDHVLMTWGIGVSFLIVSLFIYRDFVERYSAAKGALAFAFMLTGIVFFMGAGRQFTTNTLPVMRMIVTAAISIAMVDIPIFAGYDGIGYITLNIAAAAIMFSTGLDYWPWRTQAPLLIRLLMTLYTLTSLSFLMCAVVLVIDGSWVMHHAPSDWAENINLGMCLTGVGAMGAISLGLNQVRQTLHHKREAETDSLTGLFNRRALFDRAQKLPDAVAVVAFDIDHFKRINDVHGHQVGDTVLQTFGSLLASSIRQNDIAARLGGEEFAIVVTSDLVETAMLIAERVRLDFAEQKFISQAGNFSSTVSGGISYAQSHADLPTLLREADNALYDAKRTGRNKIMTYPEIVSIAPADQSWVERDKVDVMIRLRN